MMDSLPALVTASISLNRKWRELNSSPPKASDISAIYASFHQDFHEENNRYKSSNWLADHLEYIFGKKIGSLFELITGNGRFARRAASKIERVYAIDWAKVPSIGDLPPNVGFVQQDVAAGLLPHSDLVCSVDVFEHILPDGIEHVIETAFASSRKQYHVIACYDDSHSHFTVMPPSAWLALFRQFDETCRLQHLETRRADPR
ncbi:MULTISPECIES: class I SAM-dependent methyltransferase [Agrobacterium]|uniref:class I SAM-dependent methyltransferase n=1 Tax=Agrobacterium tumefaciens TaxID=358 RepID=UPI0016682906